MDWRDAREAKGWTQEDVSYYWRSAPIPEAIKKDLTHGKYTRLESTNPSTPRAKIGAVAKYELAKLLDVDLRDVDPEAADEYDAIVETVTTRGSQSATWKTASSVSATAVAA